MRIALFGKAFLLSLILALLYYALTPATLGAFLKSVALGAAASIGLAILYPEIRGIRSGDAVSVVANAATPALIGRMGQAIAPGRKNSQIRVKFGNGEEAIGIVESYEGWVSPSRIRMLYAEKAVE